MRNLRVKTFFRRGMAKQAMGWYEEALGDFDSALVLEPQNKRCGLPLLAGVVHAETAQRSAFVCSQGQGVAGTTRPRTQHFTREPHCDHSAVVGAFQEVPVPECACSVAQSSLLCAGKFCNSTVTSRSGCAGSVHLLC